MPVFPLFVQDISIHALHEEGDAKKPPPPVLMLLFLSTPSTRRATTFLAVSGYRRRYFYPRPPRGGRPGPRITVLPGPQNFYPRPPRGGRPGRSHDLHAVGSHFYPRPPRGGRLVSWLLLLYSVLISIHALHEEGDLLSSSQLRPSPSISIHALHEEGDSIVSRSGPKIRDFYPRPPRGGRPDASKPGRDGSPISIHALHEEGDHAASAQAMYDYGFLSTPSTRRATFGTDKRKTSRLFLSTPSTRRATPGLPLLCMSASISIHALHEEGDTGRVCCNQRQTGYFYPRPPRGGRRKVRFATRSFRIFLSTPSTRRATSCWVEIAS